MARTKKRRPAGPDPAESPAEFPAVPWDHAVKDFLAHLEAGEKSALTRRVYGSDLRQFEEWYRGSNGRPLLTLDLVTPTQLRDWKDDMRKRLATATVNRRISAVRSLLRWA